MDLDNEIKIYARMLYDILFMYMIQAIAIIESLDKGLLEIGAESIEELIDKVTKVKPTFLPNKEARSKLLSSSQRYKSILKRYEVLGVADYGWRQIPKYDIMIQF